MKFFLPATVSAKAAAVFTPQREVPPFSVFLASVCLCFSLLLCVSSPAVNSARNTSGRELLCQTPIRSSRHLLQKPRSREFSLSTLLSKKKNMSYAAGHQTPFLSSRPSPNCFSLLSSSTQLSSSLSPEFASSHLCNPPLGPLSFFSSTTLSTLLSYIRTLLHGSLLVPVPLLRSSRLPDVFFSTSWRLPPLPFLGVFSFSSLSSISYRGTTKSNFSLLLLPHTLLAASAPVPSGEPTPGLQSGSTHGAGSSNRLKKKGSPLMLETEGGADEAGGRKQNSFLSSEKRGLSHEALQQFYSSFPEPASPPTGVIELDVATWDLIVDVVASPQQQEQPPTHGQISSHVQQWPQQEQQQQKQQEQEEKRLEHQEKEEEQQQQLPRGPAVAAAAAVRPELVHSPVPAPPRLWLVAFMASGCAHCRRLRPILQQLQRLYSTKMRRLRAARRRALPRVQQEATAALSAAAAATAAAHRDLFQLSGGKTPEAVVKVAEQHTVMLQQEEQTMQQKMLLQISQLYSAAATATWVYPDIVFVAFDCMQNREHQYLCEHVLGISKFPTVLLLRSLPSLASLSARAAEQPPLPASVLCPPSRPQKSTLSPAAAAATDGLGAAAKGAAATAADNDSASALRSDEEKEGLGFLSFPLLRERLGQQRRHTAAGGLGKGGKGKRALLCALQEELLAEFPPFTMPSLQQLLLFLYGSAAEAASWAPVIPPPAAFLQLLLHSATPSSTAARPGSAADPAAARAAGAAAEVERRNTPAATEEAAGAAAAEKAAADAAAAAAAAAATYLEKERRRRNSNSFPTWLAGRMRGEALRQVVSFEEIRLLHYGTAAATSSTGNCGSPAVSFLFCLDLARVLQTERGEAAHSSLLLPQQLYQQQQYPKHQQSQQQHRQQQQKRERLRRGGTVVGGEVVRLDGVRGAFETYAVAAGELRLHHLFLYSLDPAVCAPRGLRSQVSFSATAQRLLLKQGQQSGAATDAEEATARTATAGAGPRAAAGGKVGSSSSKWEQQQHYPLRVVALQPALLVQGGDEEDNTDEEDACGENGVMDAVEDAEFSSSGREKRAAAVDNELNEQQEEEMKRGSSTRERRKMLLLQHILESIWTAQRTVALEQQQREDAEVDGGGGTGAAGPLHEDREKREGGRCIREDGGAEQQGRCVDLQEEEEKQQSKQRQGKYQEQQQHVKREIESCVLEENEQINAMQLPTFVGPFPPRLDQLRTSASTRGTAAVAAASLFAAVSSPPLASFVDVFRMPTLPLVGNENFIKLRVSGSSSWLSAASSSSNSSEGNLAVGRRQLVVAVLDLRVLDMLLAQFTNSQVAAAVDQAVQQQQQAVTLARSLATAAAEEAEAPKAQVAGRTEGGDSPPAEERNLAGRTSGAKSGTQAAEAVQTNLFGVDSSPGRSATVSHSSVSNSSNKQHGSGSSKDSSSSEGRSNGWLEATFSWLRSFFSSAGVGSGKTYAGQHADKLLAAAPSPFSSGVPSPFGSVSGAACRVDLVAAALSATTPSRSILPDAAATAAAAAAVASSRESASSTAVALRLVVPVEELWQLSWAAREVLLHSRVDLLQPLLPKKSHGDDGSDNRLSSRRSSPLSLFTSPSIFGMLDGFAYSEALAEYDVHVNEEGELPAVLAFDPVLPPPGVQTSTTGDFGNNNGSTCHSSSRPSRTTDMERSRSSAERSADGRSRAGGESCSSDSSDSIDLTVESGGGGCETATGAAERRTRKGGGFVAYHYRDRVRLLLKELPRGLSLLRLQALEGRRVAEEEEDEDEGELGGGTFFILPGAIIRGFAHAGRRIATWIRKEYKAASHSRLALLRLLLSLVAFFLILACTAILLFYTICCPSEDTADGVDEEEEEEEAYSEADTAELDTGEEEEDEEGEEEAAGIEEAQGAEKEEKTSTTYSGEDRENTDACKPDENKQQKTPESGLSNNCTTGSNSNSSSSPTGRAENTQASSIEEVRRRAEKMLRQKR